MVNALLLAAVLAASPDADSDAIRQVVSEFRVAVEKQDTAALQALFNKDAVIFEDGTKRSVAELALSRPMKWADEQNTGRSEGPLAYVAQAAQVDVGGGKQLTALFTFVLRKKDGAWKIAHLHWSNGAVTASKKTK
ncbi:MAG: YybH family protein [Myxococcaceae bacterium]